MFVLLTGNGRKVLFQTSVGRKRKLSTYRSKRDIYVKKHKVISQRNTGFNQNFLKISKSETNDYIDVVNTDSDYSEETESFDLSLDSDGPEEIQLNEGNNDMGNVPNDDVILDEDYDFRVSALKKLKDTDLLDKLTEILDESGQLFNFMSLLKHLTSKRIPCTNIVFVLLLERARFETRRMEVYVSLSLITSNTSLSHERLGAVCLPLKASPPPKVDGGDGLLWPRVGSRRT